MTTPYAPPGGPYGPSPSASTTEYEFDDGENAVLADLSGSMSFVGLFNVIGGMLLMLLGVVALLGAGPVALIYIVQGVVNFLIGIWTRRSASAFRRIVDTQGSDIANLMNACGELKRAYALQKIVILVTIVLVALAIVGVVVLGVRSRASY